MGETALVESQIEDSIKLIKRMDQGEYKPSKAFWYYHDDVDTWRLVLVGDKFNDMLPKQEPLAYKIIADLLNGEDMSTLSISDIKLMKSTEPLIATLNFLIGTGPDSIVRANFNSTTINGIFIKEMVILRSA